MGQFAQRGERIEPVNASQRLDPARLPSISQIIPQDTKRGAGPSREHAAILPVVPARSANDAPLAVR